MRARHVAAGLSIAMLMAPAALAQTPPLVPNPRLLSNVRGFDAGLLAGRTCQGVFDSGRRHPWSNGAVQFVFAVEGGRLTAQYAQLLGSEAHDPAEYAMTQNRPVDASGYQQLGPVRDLRVRGHKIGFVDPTGARYAVRYRAGTLAGERDPSGTSDPRMTRKNFVRLRCR
jgi:hypothetical protein